VALALEPNRAEPTSYLPGLSGTTGSGGKVEELVDYAAKSGFAYEPWQIAAFVAAARTKPFIVLAGVSGLGKTKLPRLIAQATNGELLTEPVKPDWTDSSEVIGYEDLAGVFHPGALLRVAKRAAGDSNRQYFLLLDEMNLARVEYYLAEFLSIVEERWYDSTTKSFVSPPLAPHARPDPANANWTEVSIPANLTLIGSVNMDETTHGFSRKVLDRGFIVELADVDLDNFGSSGTPAVTPWTAAEWRGAYARVTDADTQKPPVVDVVAVLGELNDYLSMLQLHVGYRVRDEVALFCLNAEPIASAFVTSGGEDVDPLDLAIMMKVLPRIQGGTQGIGTLLEVLATWAAGGEDGLGRQFPMCAKRIAIMRQRFDQEGFTSFWL
jgi:AAA domain (dynein-related subfamily)